MNGITNPTVEFKLYTFKNLWQKLPPNQTRGDEIAKLD
jgi:hypothetical protein